MVDYTKVSYPDGDGYFPYKASLPAAIIFLALFLILLILTCVDMFLFRAKVGYKYSYQSPGADIPIESKTGMNKSRRYILYTLFPLIFGLSLEFVSYLMRALAVKNPDSLIVYVIAQAFVLVAPSALAGAIYMIFGRLKFFLDANKYALIRTRFFTAIMVTIDVVSALMQASGSYLMTQADTSTTGFDLATAAFAVQIFFFGLFMVIALRFMILLNKRPTLTTIFVDQGSLTAKAPQWRRLVWGLLASMGFIVIRSILRLAEFVSGLDGVMSTKEVVFYLIDSVPIWISVVFLIIIRPHYILWDLASYKHWNEKSDTSNESNLDGTASYNEEPKE